MQVVGSNESRNVRNVMNVGERGIIKESEWFVTSRN
jgi:hypothetical protein